MKSTKLAALLTSLFIFLAMANVAAEPPVVVRTATPGQARMAPLGRTANVALIVRIETNKGNRGLSVSCDGLDGGMFASSDVLLEGEGIEGWKEKEIFDLGFNLPSATYRCEAVLIRTMDGKKKKFTSFVEVTVH